MALLHPCHSDGCCVASPSKYRTWQSKVYILIVSRYRCEINTSVTNLFYTTSCGVAFTTNRWLCAQNRSERSRDRQAHSRGYRGKSRVELRLREASSIRPAWFARISAARSRTRPHRPKLRRWRGRGADGIRGHQATPPAAETQSEIDAAHVSTPAVNAPPAIDAAFLQSSTVASAQRTRGGHAIDHTVLTLGGVPFGEGCALEQIFHVLFVICDRHNNFTACSPSLDGAKKSGRCEDSSRGTGLVRTNRAFIVNISITNDL